MIDITKDESLLNEVLIKVGRNTSNFQRLEGQLKDLLIVNDYGGSVEEIRGQIHERKKAIAKVTFGALIIRFIDEICIGDVDKVLPDPVKLPAFHAQVSYGWYSDEKRNEFILELKLLVTERNSLIHERLIEFDASSDESCSEMIDFLDAQHKKLKPVYALVDRLLVRIRNSFRGIK